MKVIYLTLTLLLACEEVTVQISKKESASTTENTTEVKSSSTTEIKLEKSETVTEDLRPFEFKKIYPDWKLANIMAIYKGYLGKLAADNKIKLNMAIMAAACMATYIPQEMSQLEYTSFSTESKEVLNKASKICSDFAPESEMKLFKYGSDIISHYTNYVKDFEDSYYEIIKSLIEINAQNVNYIHLPVIYNSCVLVQMYQYHNEVNQDQNSQEYKEAISKFSKKCSSDLKMSDYIISK